MLNHKNTNCKHRQQIRPSIPLGPKNHNYLIEEIRKKAIIALEKSIWTIIFTWIKAHARNYGNDLADKLSKETVRYKHISFNRIPKSEILQQAKDQSIAK